MNRILKWGLGLATFFSPTLQAQQAPNLEELVSAALQKDHSLAIKQLDIGLTHVDQQKLREVYLPHLDLSGKYAFMAAGINAKAPANSVPELGIALPALDDAFTNRANLVTGGLKADVVLYTGGKVPALKKALIEKEKGQTAMLEKDRQQIIADVSTAYDQLALLKQVKLVLDESKNRLRLNAETAEKAFGYGLITKFEYQKIEVAQAQLDAKIQQYEGKRTLLIHLLHTYTGLETDRIALINNELTPLNESADDRSIMGRPEIAALNASINAHRYQIDAAKSWWKPKVQASTSLGYLNMFGIQLKAKEPFPTGNTMTLKTNKLELMPNFNIGVGFKWDLFDGNKGKREVQQSKIELQKVEHEREEAMEKLELNLIKQETEMSSARAEIYVREKQRQTSLNALTQAAKEFKTGLIKTTDLVGAETDYQTAALEYLQSVFNQRRVAVELLKATGSLNVASIQ
ncbi:TolC family protein [Dyadobacter sp. CY312]|uniref:TolC family protein n=1 Tax=Dyadobacter sp. CY312 TaxID=2907303 RepID=UPI001F3DB94A|nr:TolC family protein [Dyadobacter sp. CY312]MCE7042481.1 TolC family protein [Dyadobacter sp. CY312]